jgi:hypothetical protein|tara:strand:+ start:372 stop:929 length:558 start_codon:yes stop_codon:yes gene_type:complete
MTVIDSIVKQAGDSRKSMDWYRTKVRNATGTGTTARQLIRQGKASSSPKFGLMNLFGYKATTYGTTLPYYDKFPLIIPFDQKGTRFWGINFHYLPYGLRIQLFKNVLRFATDKNMDENTMLSVNWRKLSKLNAVRPAVKSYLMGAVQSAFLNIRVNEMPVALNLPVARFVGATQSKVFSDTRKNM